MGKTGLSSDVLPARLGVQLPYLQDSGANFGACIAILVDSFSYLYEKNA